MGRHSSSLRKKKYLIINSSGKIKDSVRFTLGPWGPESEKVEN